MAERAYPHEKRRAVSRTSNTAVLSPCRRYRYTLVRDADADAGEGICMFVMLNPSKADENDDDPTIQQCVRFARKWGYRLLYVGNLFAYRTSAPKELRLAEVPIGEDNDLHLKRMAKEAEIIVCAWGVSGAYRDRAARVLSFLPAEKLHYLRLNRDGSFRHPLYLPNALRPVPYKK